MKKILLGTTGLVGAALLSSAAMAAETPKVTVGGYIDFQAGYGSDDRDANQRRVGFRNDTEITIGVEGKADSGLVYGAVIDLEADVTNDVDNEGANAARTFVYLESNFGRFELGSNSSATESMKVDASGIARATGGIDGDWFRFANFAGAGQFITSPSTFVGHGATTSVNDETFDNLNKITYYSPTFSGFQLGLSYTPDGTDRGQTVTRTDNTAGAFGEVIDVALTWDGEFEGAGISLGAGYTDGESDTAAFEDISAWNVGGVVDIANLSLAASYGDWDDSLLANNGGLDDNTYYTLGAAYDFGVFAASVTYMDSERQTAAAVTNDFDNLVIGADYALAPGLTPYAEVSFFEYDTTGTVNDNEGTSFILGTQVAF